jgi:hypothetical protein
MNDSELDIMKHRLVDSCTTLNSKYNVLNNTEVKNCKENILGHYGDDENEILIFGEDRDAKIKEAYNLINRIYHYLDNGEKKSMSEITKLNTILNNISTNYDKLLLERYNDKEYSQYNSLLDYYDRIEKNRTYDSNKQIEIDTINKMIVTENKKLEKSKYTVRLIVLIILICIFLIILIILIKF